MRRAMILGVCLLASLTACGSETPTSVSAPAGPSYDGGWLVGSGGKVGDGNNGAAPLPSSTSDSTAAFGGWTMGSGNDTEANANTASPANSDSTASAFGGWLVGSGN
jgi:hypothetical protein